MTAWLDELRMRLEFAQGSASLVLVIAEHDAVLEETRHILIDLLRATPLTVTDLGVGSHDAGPRRWAELTQSQPEGIYVITAAPASPLSLAPMARLYNVQRELLRELKGPVVLVVSSATEEAIREHAPDFFTWVAQSYVLPSLGDLAVLAKELGVTPTIVEPLVPEEEPIRFLHISDIHLRPERVKRYDQDRVLRGLVDFLEKDRASFPLDLVFVTGDLANSGKAEEYVLVVELLKKLKEVTGVPPEHMFVVPGNHDVDRGVGRWLLRTLGKDEEAVAFFEDAKNRVFHLKKLGAYAESMRALFGEGRPLGLAVGEDAVELVNVRGSHLAVASFNSAWFAQGDDDRGKLWLGEPNVDRAGQRVADMEAPFAVALMHHPFNELNEIERDNVEHYVERSFDMVVRGHLHKDKTRAIATQRGGYVEVAGPAVYQGSQWPNGCFLGEIRPKARKVRLRPYMYVSGADPWVRDARVFPDDSNNDYCHTFVAPEKGRNKSVTTRGNERAVEEAVKKASPAQQRRIAEDLGVVTPGEEAPPDMAQRTAKAARARADDSVFWQDPRKELADQRHFQAIVRAHAEMMADGGNISRTEPQFLQTALSRVVKMFPRVKSYASGQYEWTTSRTKSTFRDALGYLEGPWRSDLAGDWEVALYGASDEPDDRHAVIVFPFGLRDTKVNDMGGGLRVLDRYLVNSRAAHGALVLFGSLSPTETEPQIEYVKTPVGRDVILLRL